MDSNKLKNSIKPHQCPQCEYRAKIPSILNRHNMRVHQGKKSQVPCHICQKEIDSENIRSHVLHVHMGEGKNHKCDQCQKAFIGKNALVIHMKGVHLNIREFACELCSFKSAQKNNLRSHIASIHLPMERQWRGNSSVKNVTRRHSNIRGT